MVATNDVTGVNTTDTTTATTDDVVDAATTAVVTPAATATAATAATTASTTAATTAAATTTTTHITTHCSHISMLEYELMSVDKESSSGTSVLIQVLGHHVFLAGPLHIGCISYFVSSREICNSQRTFMSAALIGMPNSVVVTHDLFPHSNTDLSMVQRSKVLPYEVRFDLSTCLHHSNMFAQLGYSCINIFLYYRNYTEGILHFFISMSYHVILTWCPVDDYYFSFREIDFELVHCKSCVPVGHTLFKFFLCSCSHPHYVSINCLEL